MATILYHGSICLIVPATTLTAAVLFWMPSHSRHHAVILQNCQLSPIKVCSHRAMSESFSVFASVSVSMATFTLNQNYYYYYCLYFLFHAHNCLIWHRCVICIATMHDSDGKKHWYQFFMVGEPVETEWMGIWWCWIGDWYGNWCSLNTASNFISKWLFFGHRDWYGHRDRHIDRHRVNMALYRLL